MLSRWSVESKTILSSPFWLPFNFFTFPEAQKPQELVTSHVCCPQHMAFSSWSCHATKISSLLVLFLFLWLGGERDIMGASFRGIAVQSFSSCSACTRGLDSCVWDEHPSETVWYCPWCNFLFCQRINVMTYSLPSLLTLQQPPHVGECVIVHFADKKAVNVCLLLAAWFLHTLLYRKRAGSHLCNSELPVTNSWVCCGCVRPK